MENGTAQQKQRPQAIRRSMLMERAWKAVICARWLRKSRQCRKHTGNLPDRRLKRIIIIHLWNWIVTDSRWLVLGDLNWKSFWLHELRGMLQAHNRKQLQQLQQSRSCNPSLWYKLSFSFHNSQMNQKMWLYHFSSFLVTVYSALNHLRAQPSVFCFSFCIFCIAIKGT